MNLKLLVFLLSIAIALHVNAQWDSIKPKTIFYYKFTREKEKVDREPGHSYPTYKKDSLFTVRVDTIINLSGQQRKLIVFSKCLNGVVLNKTFSFIKGKLSDPADADKVGLLGLEDCDYGNDDSKKQVSVIYQIQNATYLITVPKSFFSEKLRIKATVAKFDSVLLKTETYPQLYSVYGLNGYFYFDGITYPLYPFLIPTGGSEPTKYIGGDNDYYFDFLRFDGTASFDNKLFPIADKYEYDYNVSRRRSYVTIYLTKEEGIVNADSQVYDSEKGYEFTNKLELQRIEFAK